MNTTETRALLMIRRDLTGEQFNDGTIEAWATVLSPESFDDCRAALGEATRDHAKITVRHVVEHLPEKPRDYFGGDEHICIRCGLLPAQPLKTRCEFCQKIVDDEVAAGIHDPAMLAAINAARHLGRRT